jgi:hypothetical protein
MQNAQQILGISFFIVLAVVAIAVLKSTVLSYRVIFGGEKSLSHFEKSKMPLAAVMILVVAVLSFVYGLVVAKDAALAGQFCATVTFFSAIALITLICYVLKSDKNSANK